MILILDFGSQYTQLIARKIRELNVYCEIHPYYITPKEIDLNLIKGIVFSGGPASVYRREYPKCDMEIFKLGIPILGICYGMQLIAHLLGGKVSESKVHEYGMTEFTVTKETELFYNLPQKFKVWMSHKDEVKYLPKDFQVIGSSTYSRIAAMFCEEKKIYALQFHPEVKHTEYGTEIFSNFAFKICNEKEEWTSQAIIDKIIKDVRETVKDKRAILALSGGVDSSITAEVSWRAIGNKLTCIFINNGLLPEGEEERVKRIFGEKLGKNLKIINAKQRFLRKIKNIRSPELKRKIIGNEFVKIFEKEAKKIKNVEFLIQGTLYPDVIESVSVKGPSAKIKTHHNVGGLPKKMKLKLIEPLRYLFKDEVRKIGRHLGLPDEIVDKFPIPGPGLAVRIIGNVTKKKIQILRKADKILQEEIKLAIKDEKVRKDSIWQAFAILLPVKSVGVMGDKRTYKNVIALRIVESQDGMTADWAKIPSEILGKISNRIVNEVEEVNRVVYDISSKPPATIEWE